MSSRPDPILGQELSMDTSKNAVSKGLSLANETSHLTDREKALIGLAVTSTRGCVKCTGSRLKKALEAGIPRATLMAGIDLAAMVNAGVTLSFATQGLEREGLDQSCDDGACSTGASALSLKDAVARQ
jgi:alkylhydroperoxidase/carboxymuconolactone decarboxylase family protein YurZ